MLGKKSVSFLKAAMVFIVALAFFIPSPAMVVETFDDTIVSILPHTQTVNKGENNTTVSIHPYAQVVKKGETFNVSIRVEPSEPIMDINVSRLFFDSSLLHLNSVTEGDIFDPYDTFTSGIVNNTDGTVTGISGITSNATASPGDFCRISFTAQETIGTSLLDLEYVVVTNSSSVEVPIIVIDGEVAIGWSVTLNFNEYSGKYDHVVFGEVLTANDGSPPDSYDIPKAPEPQLPYIRTWFDDGMPEPYDFLWEDYRHYPDTEKIWNLDAHWESNNSDPTDITISWDISEFNDCEYDFVVLRKYDPFAEEWYFATDMLISDNYTYAPRYFNEEWLIDHFLINATMDTTPPEITNVALTPSDPLDTEHGFGWENITCTVTDNILVDTVQLNITGPIPQIIPMVPIDGDVFFCNITLTVVGNYTNHTYHVWADDIGGNSATTTPETFTLYHNWDVNKDGKIRLKDFVCVAGHYGETGPPGWIREDVNNDGKIRLKDFVIIAGHYGEGS